MLMPDPITDTELQEWHDFEIGSAREIVSLLRQIGEKNQLVRMLIQGEQDVCVTSILDIDVQAGALIVDCSINREQNARILAAKRLRFETSLDKIRIVFSVGSIEATLYEGRPALRCPIPATLIRLQRREYYRMETPLASPVRVMVALPDGGGIEPFTVSDISVGGIALLDHKFALGTTQGQKLTGCNLVLPDGGVSTTLVVRNATELTLLNGKGCRRLGCEFLDLSRGSLANVQRYITKLERERNARMAGLG